MRDDYGRLQDMLESIRRIQERTRLGRVAFEHDEMLQVWVLYHVQMIGEAARGVSPELRASHPEIPWSRVIGMRNVLIHQYFEIDIEEVWSTVNNDLPPLQIQ